MPDLFELSDEERSEALASCGLEGEQLEDALAFCGALPHLYLKASFEVEGEEEVMEQDVAKCRIHIVLTRASHNSDSFDFSPKGKTLRACAPQFPTPKDENW